MGPRLEVGVYLQPAKNFLEKVIYTLGFGDISGVSRCRKHGVRFLLADCHMNKRSDVYFFWTSLNSVMALIQTAFFP